MNRAEGIIDATQYFEIGNNAYVVNADSHRYAAGNSESGVRVMCGNKTMPRRRQNTIQVAQNDAEPKPHHNSAVLLKEERKQVCTYKDAE